MNTPSRSPLVPLTLALVALFAPPAAAVDFDVEGCLLMEEGRSGSDGPFSASPGVFHPVVGAPVKIQERYRTRSWSATAGAGETDENGCFSFVASLTRAQGQARAVVLLSNEQQRMFDSSGILRVFSASERLSSSRRLDFGTIRSAAFDAAGQPANEGLSAWLSAGDALAAYEELVGPWPHGRLDVGVGTLGAHYNHDAISLPAGARNRYDVFLDLLGHMFVLRETGARVPPDDCLSPCGGGDAPFDVPPYTYEEDFFLCGTRALARGSHDWIFSSCEPPDAAMFEGFADFFADLLEDGNCDLEDVPFNLDGEQSQSNVHGALCDLIDIGPEETTWLHAWSDAPVVALPHLGHDDYDETDGPIADWASPIDGDAGPDGAYITTAKVLYRLLPSGGDSPLFEDFGSGVLDQVAAGLHELCVTRTKGGRDRLYCGELPSTRFDAEEVRLPNSARRLIDMDLHSTDPSDGDARIVVLVDSPHGRSLHATPFRPAVSGEPEWSLLLDGPRADELVALTGAYREDTLWLASSEHVASCVWDDCQSTYADHSGARGERGYRRGVLPAEARYDGITDLIPGRPGSPRELSIVDRNGVATLVPGTPALIEQLVASGLDRVFASQRHGLGMGPARRTSWDEPGEPTPFYTSDGGTGIYQRRALRLTQYEADRQRREAPFGDLFVSAWNVGERQAYCGSEDVRLPRVRVVRGYAGLSIDATPTQFLGHVATPAQAAAVESINWIELHSACLAEAWRGEGLPPGPPDEPSEDPEPDRDPPTVWDEDVVPPELPIDPIPVVTVPNGNGPRPGFDMPRPEKADKGQPGRP